MGSALCMWVMTTWFAETPDLLQGRAEVAVEAGAQITLLRLWVAEVPSDLEHLSWEVCKSLAFPRELGSPRSYIYLLIHSCTSGKAFLESKI